MTLTGRVYTLSKINLLRLQTTIYVERRFAILSTPSRMNKSSSGWSMQVSHTDTAVNVPTL